MNLPILSTAAQTMSSREIAELVGTTHDSVLKTVRGLIARGVVSGNETPYTHPQNGQQYPEFLLNYRNTMIVASGYSPEMRARIIDRWIELEQSAIPRTLPEALRLAADLAERVEQQQARLTVAEPKAAGFDRITQSQGELCLRDAAKTLGIPERKFTQWLIDRRWIYRDQSQTLRPYADRVRSGHLAERISTPRQTVQGEKVFAQTIVTPAGLARLGAMAERHGKLTLVGGVA